MSRFPQFILLAIIALFIACNTKTDKPIAYEQRELPADFVQFYEKFHEDSLFQMEHIQWPLRGIPSTADSITWTDDDYYFMPDLWTIHTNSGFNDTTYVRTYKVLNDMMIMEFIQMRNAPFGMERRFVKMDSSWTMIYYVGMNRLQERGG